MTISLATWFGHFYKFPRSTQPSRAHQTLATSFDSHAASGNPTHLRKHGSILAGAEKMALIWMAQRLPRWVNSDHLTVLGFAAMLGAGIAYAVAKRHPTALLFVVLALAVNWFGDSLDGTLARVRNQQRPRYGFYVDHVLDMVGTFLLLGGLALSGYMNPLLAMGMLAAYLTAAAEEFLATHVRRVFHLSFLGFGPTELRIILAIGTLYLLYKPWVHLGSLGLFRLFDVGGAVAMAGLALKLVVSAVRNTHALYIEERLPR
jgi:phosphatidylglycerophosphate synthase